MPTKNFQDHVAELQDKFGIRRKIMLMPVSALNIFDVNTSLGLVSFAYPARYDRSTGIDEFDRCLLIHEMGSIYLTENLSPVFGKIFGLAEYDDNPNMLNKVHMTLLIMKSISIFVDEICEKYFPGNTEKIIVGVTNDFAEIMRNMEAKRIPFPQQMLNVTAMLYAQAMRHNIAVTGNTQIQQQISTTFGNTMLERWRQVRQYLAKMPCLVMNKVAAETQIMTMTNDILGMFDAEFSATLRDNDGLLQLEILENKEVRYANDNAG